MAMNDTILFALAGLLHDIGKFAARAGERGTRTWDADGERDFRYYHALLTADFAEKHVPEPWRRMVKKLAGNHHRPTDARDRVIQLADHLSAGERADPADDADARKTHPPQLRSVFCSLRADDRPAPAPKYVPLTALSADAGAVFPEDEQSRAAVWPKYEALWDAFVRDADALKGAHEPAGDLAAYAESLQLLVQRYTWAMPSAYYRNVPDVSLYDHSRMAGALAAVMSGWDDAAVDVLGGAGLDASETPVALLVGGDLSGIQDFIYTITSRGATSALRGRSFYLQLLTEAILRFVLRELGLPMMNVVYSGGGKFYLLARAGDGEALAGLQKRLSGIMRRQHLGEIYASLHGVPLRALDFFGGRVSRRWTELADAQQRLKQRKFSELDDLAALFEPIGVGGDAAQCAVCGTEDASTRDDEGTAKCDQCRGFEHLGDALRRASFLSIDEVEAVPSTSARAKWDEALLEFGLRAGLADDLRSVPEPTGARRVLLALNDAAMPALQPTATTAVGQRFLTNVTPILERHELAGLRAAGVSQLPVAGSVKPFDAMEAQSEGVKRLGILRMDVDNLGRLFANERGKPGAPVEFGLGDAATLSRVATLSFAISRFFEGRVATLADALNEKDSRGARLYSIYSGGDDLFFVGAWDAVVDLATRIAEDFAHYAAGHPGMHVSAGIALVGGKYPLFRAAQDADEAEKSAKRIKNAVWFLDSAMSWPEFNAIGARAAKLAAWCTSEKVPKSLLQTLQQLHLMQHKESVGRSAVKQPKRQYTRATWLAAYQLTRVAESLNNEPAIKAEVMGIRDELMQPDAPFGALAFAARWAQLKIR